MNWLAELPIWLWTAVGIYIVGAVWFTYEIVTAPMIEG